MPDLGDDGLTRYPKNSQEGLINVCDCRMPLSDIEKNCNRQRGR